MSRKRSAPQRPRDMNQLAHRIGALATHEVEDKSQVGPSPAARKRGDARASKLSPKRRKEIARKAARARWGKEG